MKRFMISAFAAVALFAAATTLLLRSPSTELSARTAAMQEHSPSALQPEPRVVKQRIVVSTAQ